MQIYGCRLISSAKTCVTLVAEQRRKILIFHLQIIAAHVNFLKNVNTTGGSYTFTVAETGIPLDSLRTNNVTYSSFESFLLLIPSSAGGRRRLIAYEFRLKYVRCRFCGY